MAKIPVGILGATGAVGQRFVQLLAEPSLVRGGRGRRLRPLRGQDLRGGLHLAPARDAPDRGWPKLTVVSIDGPFRSKLLFSGLDSSVAGEAEIALAGRGPRRRLQLAQPPDGPRRAAAHPRGQPRPPGRPRGPAQAHGRRLHRHQPQLQRGGPGHGPGAAAPRLRHRVGGGGDAAGPLRRRLSRRRLPGHRGQRRSRTSAAARRRRSRASRRRSWALRRAAPSCPPPSRSPPPSTAWPCPTATPWPCSCSSPKKARVRRGGARPRRVPRRAAGARAAHRPAPAHPRAHAPDRPQPRLDRDREGGMAVSVGRVREDRLFDLKLEALVHNTIRGAAGAAILNAELLQARGPPAVIVMKFGGTSVGSAERIRALAERVRERLRRQPGGRGLGPRRHHRPADPRRPPRPRPRPRERASRPGRWWPGTRTRSASSSRPARSAAACSAHVEAVAGELRILYTGVHYLEELTPRSLDAISAMGERLSCEIVAAALEHAGLPARALDARARPRHRRRLRPGPAAHGGHGRGARARPAPRRGGRGAGPRRLHRGHARRGHHHARPRRLRLVGRDRRRAPARGGDPDLDRRGRHDDRRPADRSRAPASSRRSASTRRRSWPTSGPRSCTPPPSSPRSRRASRSAS